MKFKKGFEMYFQACGAYIPIDSVKMHFVEAKLIVYLLKT